MSLIVIGGHSRSVGKTSVVAGLIAALPEYNWTALKITQYGHGVCSANGEPCHCATDDHSWAISEEQDRSGESDTSRFLAAGAARAWWVRTEQGRLAEAMPTVRRKLAESGNAILESNSILKFLRPGSLPHRARSRDRGLQEDQPRNFSIGPTRSSCTRTQRQPVAWRRSLAETGGGTSHVSYFSAGIRHALRSSNL